MKIDGIIVGGQNVSLTNTTDILSRLNVGDVLKAQILEFTASQIMLKLYDGTTLTASTQSPIDAKKGDFVDFNVVGKDGNQLVLETAKSNNKKADGMESELKKQLRNSDIKPDLKNLEVAKAIIQNQLPINKEIFGKVVDFLLKFKDLTPDKAAFLTANHFKTEEKNIHALNQLVDAKAKLDTGLKDILNSLNGIKDQGVLKKIEESLSKFDTLQSVKHSNSEIEVNPAGPKNTQGQVSTAIENQSAFIKNLIAKEMQGSNNSIVNKLPEALGQKDMDVLVSMAASDKDNTQGIDSLLRSKVKNFDALPANEQNRLKDALKDLILRIKQENSPLEDVHAKDTATKDDTRPDNIINKTFEGFSVKIQSTSLEKDLHVQKLYRDVYEKLEAIKENILSSALSNKDDIVQKIDQLQNNMRFINELNNHSTYIQIPLNMFEKRTTGELYILKRDAKKKKIDPENVTMLVSLNTENIGRIDSLININKKNIGLNIRVENKEVQCFVKEYHDELYNRLKDKGYKLVDLKCRIMENEPDLLNAQSFMKKELESNRVGIDYKI